MEIWLGFMFGFLGSPHCIGMCGPIALALPSGGYKIGFAWMGRILLYNLGRALTYAAMGGGLGLIGSSVAGFGFQNEISIGVGVFMVLMALVPTKLSRIIFSNQAVNTFPDRIKRRFNSLMTQHGYFSLLSIGLINGLLPCGFVYMALAGSLALADWFNGMMYMFLFGLGTTPALFAVSFFGQMVSVNVRQKLTRLAPIAIGGLGIIFILRGMELGIPYLSPKAPVEIHQTIHTCH
jgi:hypothetical protein